MLQSEIDQQAVKSHRRSIGWSGETIILKTREGLEVEVKESNQVWQCDHTRVDLLVVDQVGEVLGRPWLSTIVDTHSRCIMGIHLGMEAPSAVVVCLALRHAILPKQYSTTYELQQVWVLCLRRKPCDGLGWILDCIDDLLWFLRFQVVNYP